jgi:anti-sigma B factor antagonist
MPESSITSVEELSDLVVLHVVVEELNEAQLQQLQIEVRAAADANPGRPCVVDLARVSFMPSLSLAALVRVYTEFQGRQQRLILAGLQPQVRDLFVMTRLDRLFELQEDVAAAMRAVRPA